MKLVYEDLVLRDSRQSFRYFKVNEERLNPFWHYHPELELTLIYQGKGTRFVGDSILPYQPLDLVLVGENLPHHWVSTDSIENNAQKAIVIQFPKNIFEYFPECNAFTNLFEKAEKGIQFIEPSNELIELLIGFDKNSKIQRLSILITILSQLLAHQTVKTLSSVSYKNQLGNQKNQNKIANTTTYILENLDKKLTIEHMADYTNLVPQSFCRWFKNAVGNTFITYLNTARIERACQMLLNSNIAISEICFIVGFESLSHFNRTFLVLKDMSPRAYRKEYKA